MTDYKLVCFDVDGTLVDNIVFSWQLFHDYFKTDEKKRIKVREKYYKGEISYLEWANHDINMWVEKKARKEDFFNALKHNDVKLMNGALETLNKLREKGIKLAIISGSLNVILEYVLPNYREYFSDVFLSRIDFDKDGNIRKVEATEYDMIKKAAALRIIARKENLDLRECVFVGDHYNDVEIAKEAGLSIAFDCKDERLREAADHAIDKKDLREILRYIL
ncbi:HAD family phosphatase [Candidatus Woesearchaeota archaeon]|nr:HAD family phosphatase [Candidatus Woesearchaeota archaeon]